MQKLLGLLTGLSAVFLVFMLGAVVTYFELFPYHYYRGAFVAAEALLVKPDSQDSEVLYLGAKAFEPEDAVTPVVRWDASGVARYDPERAYNGYTIYTPVRSEYPVRLVDMAGDLIWQWQIDWDAIVGPRLDGLPIRIDSELAAKSALGIGEPTLFPNGDLLVVVNTAWYTPWGAALIKVDKNGDLIWSYLRQVHHEVSVAPSGNIYALTHTIVEDPWPGLETIVTPFVDDQIAVISPLGEELQVVSILEAIQNSSYSALLAYANPADPKGDLLHVNSIFFLDSEHAAYLPNAQAGDVLISLRNADVLAVVSLADEVVKWAVRGPWHMQHDVDVLDNGNLQLFDNRGDLRNGGRSRIIEFNPRTLEMVWEFPGGSGERLYTSVLGSQKSLPNGNTLIAESNNGRILEVNRAGQVVWEYNVPELREKKDGRRLAAAIFANRFAPGALDFLPTARAGAGN